MKYIRNKIILLVIIILAASFLITGTISVSSIRKLGDESSSEKLSMICESTQENLDDLLDDLQQSVDTVYHFANSELYSLSFSDLQQNVRSVRRLCKSIVGHLEGVNGYYYRVSPQTANGTLGFWYVKDPDTQEFYIHALTGLDEYDPENLGRFGWYALPQQTGGPVWMDPYLNENLGKTVISYAAPIYFGSMFVGVLGMDMDVSMLTDRIKNIKVYDSGYAFLLDSKNDPVYFPESADSGVLDLLSGEILSTEGEVFTYTSGGTEMRIVWRPLTNGMKLFVTVPGSEIDAAWVNLVKEIVLAAAILLIIFMIVVIIFSVGLTRPLKRLTDAAVLVNQGNYDVELECSSKDEVGILTAAFKKLIEYLRDYIGDLNNKVYLDALTDLRNKGAFDLMCRELQKKAEDPDRTELLSYAIVMFDCNDLKTVNDVYGHEKGDLYLKRASALICSVFAHSPVFRVGGDEFTAILQGQDLENIEELLARFEMDAKNISALAKDPWDEVHAAYGTGIYDPQKDRDIESVIERADQNMYKKKKEMKEDVRNKT